MFLVLELRTFLLIVVHNLNKWHSNERTKYICSHEKIKQVRIKTRHCSNVRESWQMKWSLLQVELGNDASIVQDCSSWLRNSEDSKLELLLFSSNSILIVHASFNVKKITSLECKWLHALSVYVDWKETSFAHLLRIPINVVGT